MKSLSALLLMITTLAAADEPPLSVEEMSHAEESPLELDPVEVTGLGLSYQQELTLRLIRQAYEKPKSQRQEDRDVLVCWMEEATGSHFNHLNCARNGDIWALARPNGLTAPTVPMGGYGTILRTERPVNRAKLERALAELPGSAEFDQEFLAKVLAGGTPPLGIPEDAELEQFARAYDRVDRLARRGASEERQVAAIEDEGLSLRRYNNIADMVETYQSLENDVARRLAGMD